jgi:hypothetical protein
MKDRQQHHIRRYGLATTGLCSRWRRCESSIAAVLCHKSSTDPREPF